MPLRTRTLLRGGWLVTMVPGSQPFHGDLLIEDDCIPTGLSADVCTNVGGDLFGAMRVATALQRGTDHAAAMARDETLGAVSLTAREVLAMATLDGARACPSAPTHRIWHR